MTINKEDIKMTDHIQDDGTKFTGGSRSYAPLWVDIVTPAILKAGAAVVLQNWDEELVSHVHISEHKNKLRQLISHNKGDEPKQN